MRSIDIQRYIYNKSQKYHRNFMNILSGLYKTFWNFVSAAMRHDYRDYNSKI